MNSRKYLALRIASFFVLAAFPLAPAGTGQCGKPTAPIAVLTPDAVPPDSWAGHAPKRAIVVLLVVVDEKGKVQDPTVTQSSGKDVDKKALEAVRHWRFKPARCDGQPLRTKISVEMKITLQ